MTCMAGQSFALPAELRQILDNSVAAIDTAKMDVVAKQGTKEETMQDSTAAYDEARILISRVKSYLVSQMPQLQQDKLLQSYLLENPMPRPFNSIYRILEAIVQENGNQAGKPWELPAEIQTDVTASRNKMAAFQVSVEAAKGAYHESVQTQQNSVASGRIIARRIREFLYAMLPGCKKDMKLKEYGLDPWD